MIKHVPWVLALKSSALLQIIPDGLHTSLYVTHLDSTVSFCTLVLTNTCVRECMAIKQSDKEGTSRRSQLLPVRKILNCVSIVKLSQSLAPACNVNTWEKLR